MDSADLDLSRTICVKGTSCVLHCNDRVALSIELGKHLVLWNSDQDLGLWIDRFDARSNFTRYDEIDFSTNAGYSTSYTLDFPPQEELDLERYCDLPKDQSGYISAGSDDGPDDDADSLEGVQRSAYSHQYSECNPLIRNTNVSQILGQQHDSAECIHLPIEVPEELALPLTKKHLNIILHTALKTRKSGQLEVFLKLKQQGNPLFEFLNAGSRCYDFYVYIKSLPEDLFWKCMFGKLPNERSDEDGKESADAPSSAACVPSALLYLQSYGGDDDDSGSNGSEGKATLKGVPHSTAYTDEHIDDNGEAEIDIKAKNVIDVAWAQQPPLDSISTIHEMSNEEYNYADGLMEDVDANKIWGSSSNDIGIEEKRQDESIKADRLHRAKLLAGHFLVSSADGNSSSLAAAEFDSSVSKCDIPADRRHERIRSRSSTDRSREDERSSSSNRRRKRSSREESGGEDRDRRRKKRSRRCDRYDSDHSESSSSTSCSSRSRRRREKTIFRLPLESGLDVTRESKVSSNGQEDVGNSSDQCTAHKTSLTMQERIKLALAKEKLLFL